MAELQGKNILICCNLKKERVLLFNFFDSCESEMIYTAKDIEGCNEILSSEVIDCLLIECSDELINCPRQLHGLIKNFNNLRTALLINTDMDMPNSLFVQFKQVASIVFFSPLSILELDVKFTELFSKKLIENTLEEEPLMEEQLKQGDSSLDELWNVFFNDSIQARVIVDANSQKIIKVNEKFLEVFNLSENFVIGKSWNFLDDKKNHIHYENYIKEINSKDYTSFSIKFPLNDEIPSLNCLYQLGAVNGEIVFIGNISSEQVNGVSNEAREILTTINKLENSSDDLLKCLDALRNYLNYKFVVYFEFEENKLLKPLVSGEVKPVKKFLEESMGSLLPIMEANKIVKIDRNNKAGDYLEILDKNNLQRFCIFPIFHGSKTYGCIVAASDRSTDDWHTSTVIFSALANHCKFNLFQKSIIQQQEVDGRIDKLTGLPNRDSLMDKFSKVIEEGLDADAYISLLIVGIDKINHFNKNLGIDLTNQILKNIAKIIVNNIHNLGVVYRLSGDEFTILLKPHGDKTKAETIALKLIEELNKPLLISNGDEVYVGFNIGASIFPDDGQTVLSMLKNADLAMYDARLEGKNNHVVFKYSKTGRTLKQKVEMEDDLRLAINSKHIHVFFQPKINAITEDIVGFEALVRWIDPEIGMINPGQFIPLAEETGLINQIGEYVTQRSCEMIGKWQKKYGLILSCSINLSAIQLLDKMLPQKLEKIINDSGVHPHFIDFEITETMNLDDIPNLVESLNKIVEIGCTLSIDDFGTGHSSLDYVKRIPATYIKIDQSFVKNIGLNPEDEAILDATISIAKRLDRKLIAEGVETEEQRDYLLERECEYLQGFLFSKPLHEDEIEKLLDQRVKLMGTS